MKEKVILFKNLFYDESEYDLIFINDYNVCIQKKIVMNTYRSWKLLFLPFLVSDFRGVIVIFSD